MTMSQPIPVGTHGQSAKAGCRIHEFPFDERGLYSRRQLLTMFGTGAALSLATWEAAGMEVLKPGAEPFYHGEELRKFAEAMPVTRYRVGLAHPEAGVLACGRIVTKAEFAELVKDASPVLIPEDSEFFASSPGPFHVAIIPVPAFWHPDDAMATPPDAHNSKSREATYADALAFNRDQLRGVVRRWALVRTNAGGQNARLLIVPTPRGWRPERATDMIPCEHTGLSHAAAKEHARRINKATLKLAKGGKPVTEWAVPVRTPEGGAA